MVVRIRLQRFGNTHRPFYRIVIADARAPRDGRFIERVQLLFITTFYLLHATFIHFAFTEILLQLTYIVNCKLYITIYLTFNARLVHTIRFQQKIILKN
jgi:hypothetical protein